MRAQSMTGLYPPRHLQGPDSEQNQPHGHPDSLRVWQSGVRIAPPSPAKIPQRQSRKQCRKSRRGRVPMEGLLPIPPAQGHHTAGHSTGCAGESRQSFESAAGEQIRDRLEECGRPGSASSNQTDQRHPGNPPHATVRTMNSINVKSARTKHPSSTACSTVAAIPRQSSQRCRAANANPRKSHR